MELLWGDRGCEGQSGAVCDGIHQGLQVEGRVPALLTLELELLCSWRGSGALQVFSSAPGLF